ncbi:MAG: DUF4112 domain-containing protein [Porphyrobacter sp.]|nr:DUF4112 domain-containing protein [Porphyrobacter sp.]
MESTHASPRRPQPLRVPFPTGTDPHSIRHRIEALEKLLEHGFKVPGIGYEFGLDAIVGLIPVVGDFIGAAFGAYLIWEAKNLGLPKWKLWRMAGNVGLDTAVGFVPVVGDALDFAFRSNTRNLRIVKRHLDKHHPATRVIEG